MIIVTRTSNPDLSLTFSSEVLLVTDTAALLALIPKSNATLKAQVQALIKRIRVTEVVDSTMVPPDNEWAGVNLDTIMRQRLIAALKEGIAAELDK